MSDLGPCRLWAGAATSAGYGARWFEGKVRLAHRVAFYEMTGTWPAVVRHKCDTPLCVEPKHLEAGSQKDNVRDAQRRGRLRGGSKTLNAGMPSWRTDPAAYKRERRRRVAAGTWVNRP